MALVHGELTQSIIGAAIAVHTRLGPGFIESIYGNALCVELRRRALPYRREHEIPLSYDGVEVGFHRLDLLVEDTIVLELKAIRHIEDVHFAIVRSYLRAARLEHGLLINFGATRLQVRRVIADRPPPGSLGS